MVAKCRPHPFVTYQQQSAPCQRPDWNCRFDVILSSSVLEYVTDLDATVQCIADWIKPGGTVLVSMPNWRSLDRRCERIRYWLRGPAPYFTHVKNFHSVGQLQALSLAKGLQPAGVQYYARNKLISRCGQRIGLPDKWCGNLYLAKFRRPG
jgi:SAM-dependent methyltransferase